MRQIYRRQRYRGEPHLFCVYSQPKEYHSVTLSSFTKGQLLDYGSIDRLMDVNMTRSDLFSNHLTGEIPEEIDTLTGVIWIEAITIFLIWRNATTIHVF
jgi:hypothetical protein